MLRFWLQLWWVMFKTMFMARLATAYENLALQAILPYSGVAGTVTISMINGSYVASTAGSYSTLPIVAGMTYAGITSLVGGTVLYVIDSTHACLSTAASGTITTQVLTFSVAPQYTSLHTADPGTTGASETSGGAGPYARQSTSFGVIASGANASNTAQNFTGMPSITSAYFGIWTAVSSGTYICGGALGASLTIPAGSTVSFAIGSISSGES